jgi:UDP-glucose 4-epimerase
MNILLTGGTGYIGSHTAIVLLDAGYNVILFDNFSNSAEDVVSQIESITNKSPVFVKGDVRDSRKLSQVLGDQKIDAVIHFAGLKAVGESVHSPIKYFDNNVSGTISLVKAMKECNIKKLVFSSSATVYGEPKYLPLDEQHSISVMNPYGRTKLQCEQFLTEVAHSDASWRVTCLRYFNPIGAHDSGLIGERPLGVPNNLSPYIARVAKGLLPHVAIFGDDYETLDGTGVRDYIHVMDLAEGHLAALKQLSNRKSSVEVFNLGTGIGHSVLEVIAAFEIACEKPIPRLITPRRPGDIGSCFANTQKAHKILNWSAKRSLADMCESAWKFQKKL